MLTHPKGMSDEDKAEAERLYAESPESWATFMVSWWESQGVSREQQILLIMEAKRREDVN